MAVVNMSDLAASPVGRLVPVEFPVSGQMARCDAFVPYSLPETMDLSPSTWEAAIDAAAELGRLAGMTRSLHVEPSLLATLAVRREALSTSALEGTYAPVVDVLAGEVAPSSPRTVAVTEVLNFVKAVEHGVQRLADLPVCMRLAGELHEILVSGTPSEDWQKGKVRKTPVVIGPADAIDPVRRIQEARFVPAPPGGLLLDGLSRWERWINTAAMHSIPRIAVSHYQFEVLHPFTDGNGRIGRLLAVLQLIEAGMLDAPVINLSPYFEVRRDEYIDLLNKVSVTGRWDEWITFFCRALYDQAADGVQRAKELLAWRDRTLAALRAAAARGTVLSVVDQLMELPVVTSRSIVDRQGVSTGAAMRSIARLVELGIVREITGRSYAKVYAAEELLALFDRRGP